MKLGIIGSGAIVTSFLPELVRMEEMEVTAIMDIPQAKEHLEELCRDNGVPHAVTDYNEFIRLDFDTIY